MSWGIGDAAFFDRVAPLYDRLHPSPDRRRYERAFDAAERDVERVLDVAAGTGRVGGSLGGDREVVVCDRSRGMLRRARVPAIQGGARRLPIGTGTIDAAVCVDALHHVQALGRVCAELRRVLAPGGVAVIVDFDPGTLRGRAVALAERAAGLGSSFYHPDEIRDALDAAGFVSTRHSGGFVRVVSGVAPQPTNH